VEQKVEAAEAAGADFAESQQPAAATASEKRRMEPPQPLQVAKRRSLPAAAGTAGLAAAQPQQPVVPVMLRAAPVRADRSNEALRTPRSKPMPPGTDTFWWKPARINADSAAAGPNGIVAACGLEPGMCTVVICSVHLQRNVTQNKHKVFADPENAPVMNADLERMRVTALNPDGSLECKHKLQKKFEKVDCNGAAYFANTFIEPQYTYAEANRRLAHEPTDQVVGGVPTQSNAIERQNGMQKQVTARLRTHAPHTMTHALPCAQRVCTPPSPHGVYYAAPLVAGEVVQARGLHTAPHGGV
jgi:hypothetical protein